MHVWGKKRDTLELNDVEKFHIDMLKSYQSQQKKFDKILINIALDDINDMTLFNFLKEEISKVLVNKNVEFRYCKNEPGKGEYVTFRPYVFDRIGEDVNIFYSHFKGYCTYVKIYRESFPTRIVNLCEMFWSYIMYKYSLNMSNVQKNLKDNSIYCWFMYKNSENDPNIEFYKTYQNHIQNGDERFKGYVADDLHKYSPGSFMWYNLKNLGKSLEDKPLITSITEEYLIKNSEPEVINLCTHFCELYLMPYLKEDECYSVNDFIKEVKDMSATIYTQLYPAKTIAREYLNEFDKYLIEKGLI